MRRLATLELVVILLMNMHMIMKGHEKKRTKRLQKKEMNYLSVGTALVLCVRETSIS